MKVPKELLTIARVLSGLERPVAFVGGMVGPLLLTDTGAAPPRATKDVDLVVRVDSLAEYYDLAEKLRGRGLMELPLEGAPICRWVHAGIPVDVMPTEPSVLGFGNPWYDGAVEHPRTIDHDGVSIPIVDASHFVATKLEAWLARGDDDVLHHDLEDVMSVIDGRHELLAELEASAPDLRGFVARQIRSCLSRRDFAENLDHQFRGDAGSQGRVELLRERLEAIAGLAADGDGAIEPIVERSSDTIVESPHRETVVWSAVRSSNLVAVAYEPIALRLHVEFRSGSRYIYSGVPATIYRALLGAGSKGSFFSRYIRGRYRFVRVG